MGLGCVAGSVECDMLELCMSKNYESRCNVLFCSSLWRKPTTLKKKKAAMEINKTAITTPKLTSLSLFCEMPLSAKAMQLNTPSSEVAPKNRSVFLRRFGSMDADLSSKITRWTHHVIPKHTMKLMSVRIPTLNSSVGLICLSEAINAATAPMEKEEANPAKRSNWSPEFGVADGLPVIILSIRI